MFQSRDDHHDDTSWSLGLLAAYPEPAQPDLLRLPSHRASVPGILLDCGLEACVMPVLTELGHNPCSTWDRGVRQLALHLGNARSRPLSNAEVSNSCLEDKTKPKIYCRLY